MDVIAVVSDTHDRLENISAVVDGILEHGIKVTVHCGDYVSPFSLKAFERLSGKCMFIGVTGNNDGDHFLLARVAGMLGFRVVNYPILVTDIEGVKLAIMHGFGSTEDTIRIVNSVARGGLADIVLYGHTHKFDFRKVGESIVINPGTVAGYLSDEATFAILDLEKKKVEKVVLS